MAEVGRRGHAYGPIDLVLAEIVLHDIGKLQERPTKRAASYTPTGMGGTALGIVMVRLSTDRWLPDDLRAHLEYLIASHHGIREHGRRLSLRPSRRSSWRRSMNRCEVEPGAKAKPRIHDALTVPSGWGVFLGG